MTPAPLSKPHILFTGKIAAFFKKQTEREVQNASKLLLKLTIQEDHKKQFLKGIYIHWSAKTFFRVWCKQPVSFRSSHLSGELPQEL